MNRTKILSYVIFMVLSSLFLSGCAHRPQLNPGELISVAEQIVQRQLDAYNKRDIDAFIATYNPAIQIYRHPDQLLYDSLDQMRERYAAMFLQTPDLHCQIVNRVVLGDYVIDKERVTGFPNGKVVRAVAIYEVKEALITRVWFIRE